MLPRNARPLFLLLLILLFVAAPVMAAPVLTVTLTHNGNAKATYTNPAMSDFATGSSDGQVAIALTNTGDTPTAGGIAFDVTLGGGLTYNALAGGSSILFTCSGTTTVTCSTAGSITNGATETVIFTVNAPTAGVGPFTNSYAVTNGGGGGTPTGSDATSFSVVNPVVDLVITGLSHNGNAPGNHILINSNDARVTVTLQNQGTVNSSGTVTLTIYLDNVTFFPPQVAGSLFNNCSGSSTVTCTTNAAITPGTGDTVTIRVQAPGAPLFDRLNRASLFGGGDNTLSNAQDSFSIVSPGTATPTTAPGTFTPFPTFPPVPGVPGAPGTAVIPTAVVTATLIPQPATRTPLPRPANAGQAVGPIPRTDVTVVVDRDGVNVRLLPALGAEVIATVNAGFSTTILARSPDNEWVEVQINGELGWIGTAVLAIVSGDLNSAPVADPRTIPYGGFENPRAGLTSVTSQYTGKLQNSGLRVRGGPSRAYPVLANAPRYTIFSILGRTSDNLWLQVNFEGTLGWVAMQFVELQQGLGTLDALPIDGIVADALPISEPTGDSLTDTLRLMLSRIDLAQPSLDAIRGIWTNIALGQSAQCGNYPARPTNMNIPNPVLAPFYGTLFPLNTDFNTAMTNLRLAIDLLIDACSRPQPPAGVVGQAVVQQALDAINATDALFASLRQRLIALLPPEGPIGDDECLFSFNNRSQVVPRLRTGEAKIVHLSRSNFVLGFCFDGGTGQSFSLQALRVNGNASPRVTVSAFDNPTNFIATGEIGTSALESNTNSVTLQPILITQTGRYLVILADLDGAPDGPLSSDIALLLTDITSGGGGVTLGIDPATGNVIISPNPISPVIGIGVTTPGIPGGISLTPIGTG